MNRRILLHICCGPCATYPVLALRQVGYNVRGYFYNPNIQPFGEHERRLCSLEDYAREVSLPLMVEPGYDIGAYMRETVPCSTREQRCAACYRLRLTQVARHARAEGIDEFTTTLLVSPHQMHDSLARVASEIGVREAVRFTYFDFRVGWPERVRLTRQYDLYRQRYCGCVHSYYEAEMERRQHKNRKPPGG